MTDPFTRIRTSAVPAESGRVPSIGTALIPLRDAAFFSFPSPALPEKRSILPCTGSGRSPLKSSMILGFPALRRKVWAPRSRDMLSIFTECWAASSYLSDLIRFLIFLRAVSGARRHVSGIEYDAIIAGDEETPLHPRGSELGTSRVSDIFPFFSSLTAIKAVSLQSTPLSMDSLTRAFRMWVFKFSERSYSGLSFFSGAASRRLRASSNSSSSM